MTLTPLLNAAPAVQIHVAAAIAALLTGAAVAFLQKGTPAHLGFGRLAALGIVIVAVSSYWIRPRDGGFSWIHLLSVFSLLSIALGVYFRRRGMVDQHKRWMTGAYAGLVGAGIFTLLPGRVMNAVVFGG